MSIHLPPSLTPAARREVCEAAARFLRGSRAVLQVMQGDLNATIRPRGGGWLSKELKSGAWQFLSCPANHRSPSNFVRMLTEGGAWHVFETLTEGLLLAAEFITLFCPRQQLLGLNTHLAQLVSMVSNPERVRPRDRVARMFDLRRLSDGQRDTVGAGLSLLLSWSLLGRWSPEDCMSAYRQLMMPAAPLRASAMVVAPVDTAHLHHAMRALRQGRRVTASWTSHKDAAFRQKIHVRPAILEGVNSTSATSRALAFSVRNFAPSPGSAPMGRCSLRIERVLSLSL